MSLKYKIDEKTFTIMQLNTRGNNNTHKFDRLKLMISNLKFKCDIIVLGETKLKTRFPSNIYHLNGYDKFNCCRDSKNSGGGLLLYVKKNIFVKSITKETSTFEKIKLIEHKWKRV
jgi:hypothetical protein